MSEILRLGLTHEGARLPDGVPLPTRLILKLPTGDLTVRRLTAPFGLFRREAHFYRRLRSSIGSWAPHCYAVLDPGDGNPALLLEDAAGEPTDLTRACSPNEAERVLDCMAELHARWWNTADPNVRSELPGAAAMERSALPMRIHGLLARTPGALAQRLPPTSVAFVPLLADGLEDIVARVWAATPPTCLHTDMRLGNLLFGGDAGICVLDWQTASHGPAALDVAYFLASSLEAETFAAGRERLLAHYHRTLVANGVSSYGLAALELDIARSLLLCAAIATVACLSVIGLIDVKGQAGLDRWMQRAFAAIEVTGARAHLASPS